MIGGGRSLEILAKPGVTSKISPEDLRRKEQNKLKVIKISQIPVEDPRRTKNNTLRKTRIGY